MNPPPIRNVVVASTSFQVKGYVLKQLCHKLLDLDVLKRSIQSST